MSRENHTRVKTRRRAFVSFVLAVCVLAAGGALVTWTLARGTAAVGEHVDIDWQRKAQVKEVTAQVVERLAARHGVSHVDASEGLQPVFTITLDDDADWDQTALSTKNACQRAAREYPNRIQRIDVYCFLTQTKRVNQLTDTLSEKLRALDSVSLARIDSRTTPTLTVTLKPSAKWESVNAQVHRLCQAAADDYSGVPVNAEFTCYVHQGDTTVETDPY